MLYDMFYVVGSLLPSHSSSCFAFICLLTSLHSISRPSLSVFTSSSLLASVFSSIVVQFPPFVELLQDSLSVHLSRIMLSDNDAEVISSSE